MTHIEHWSYLRAVRTVKDSYGVSIVVAQRDGHAQNYTYTGEADIAWLLGKPVSLTLDNSLYVTEVVETTDTMRQLSEPTKPALPTAEEITDAEYRRTVTRVVERLREVADEMEHAALATAEHDGHVAASAAALNALHWGIANMPVRQMLRDASTAQTARVEARR